MDVTTEQMDSPFPIIKMHHIPIAYNFEQIKKQWEVGDTEKKLLIPLKDWNKNMKNQSKTIASVYSRRKRVMDRFYQLGEVEFANSYSGMNFQLLRGKF
jgi:hypothetical protein